MARTDLQLNNNDLVIVNGDAVIAASDQQHKQDTISAFPGWWKESPADGVGLMQYLKSAGKQNALAKSITNQLNSDGYPSVRPVITYSNGTLLNVAI